MRFTRMNVTPMNSSAQEYDRKFRVRGLREQGWGRGLMAVAVLIWLWLGYLLAFPFSVDGHRGAIECKSRAFHETGYLRESYLVDEGDTCDGARDWGPITMRPAALPPLRHRRCRPVRVGYLDGPHRRVRRGHRPPEHRRVVLSPVRPGRVACRGVQGSGHRLLPAQGDGELDLPEKQTMPRTDSLGLRRRGLGPVLLEQPAPTARHAGIAGIAAKASELVMPSWGTAHVSSMLTWVQASPGRGR